MSKSVEEFMQYLNDYFSKQMSVSIDDVAEDSDYIREQEMEIPKLYPAVYDFCCEQSVSFMRYSAMKQLYDYIFKVYFNYCTHYRTKDKSNLNNFMSLLDKSMTRIYEKHSCDHDSDNLFKRQAAANWAESLSLYKSIIPKLMKEGGFELDPTKDDFMDFFDSKVGMNMCDKSTDYTPYYNAFIFVHRAAEMDAADGDTDGKEFVKYLFNNLESAMKSTNMIDSADEYAKFAHTKEILTNIAKEGGYLDGE